MEQIVIHRIRPDEWDDAMGLAWRTFLRFEAADYDQEGIDSFLGFISDERLKKMWMIGEFPIYGAYIREEDGEKMVGMAAWRSQNHLSLLFVLSEYQQRGIGKRLIETVCEQVGLSSSADCLTVHAAPYAYEFYHKLAFEDTDAETVKEGIRYTPMKRDLSIAFRD